jgi:hypothetical protein
MRITMPTSTMMLLALEAAETEAAEAEAAEAEAAEAEAVEAEAVEAEAAKVVVVGESSQRASSEPSARIQAGTTTAFIITNLKRNAFSVLAVRKNIILRIFRCFTICHSIPIVSSLNSNRFWVWARLNCVSEQLGARRAAYLCF